jgi:NAD(P)-dependent dehydrogenase (short-subunit alcohol dehydrogenase family)
VQAGERQLRFGFDADGTEHAIAARARLLFRGREQGRPADARISDQYQRLPLGTALGDQAGQHGQFPVPAHQPRRYHGATIRARAPSVREHHALGKKIAMNPDLTGQTAVVTGGSKGIGLAIVRALAGRGAHVIAGAKQSSAELDQLVRTGHVRAVEVDLAAEPGPAELVAAAGQRVDILVNNVGGAPARPGGFLSITDQDWLATINLDLMTAIRACRAALPAMLAAGSGTIITICSVNARLPDPAVLDYSVAKAGLAAFCKALSKEVGPRGIRVNTVSPGPVATDLWLGSGGVAQTVGAATGAAPEDVAGQAASQMVTGRFTQPSEVADLVLFLASGSAGNITGADFTIDGGLVPTW